MTDDTEMGLMFIIYTIILFIVLSLKYGLAPIGSITIIFFVIDCCVHAIYANRCCNSCYECSL